MFFAFNPNGKSSGDAESVSNPLIKRLHLTDQPEIEQHFMRLDAKTRRMRFGGSVGEQFVKDYAQRTIKIDSIIFGAFVESKLRAVAELRSTSGYLLTSAEAAFSVEREWQNQGIGTALMTRLVAAAQNRGVRKIHMICLRENCHMQHLVSKHHGVMEFDQNEVGATLDQPSPTPLSLAEEMTGEAVDYVHAILHRA